MNKSKKMFQDPQTRQMNWPKMSEKNPRHFFSKVQNMIVFSIIYMIRIRFFGPRELIKKTFSGGVVVVKVFLAAKKEVNEMEARESTLA